MANADKGGWSEILPVGMLVGGHRIEELASQGGFAAVYRARRLSGGEEVAIKVLGQDLTASAQLRRRFHQEAKALLKLRHPNIVGVREVGELLDGRPYFVMDWIPGQDLRAFIQSRGALTPREALALMEEMGAGLSAAHQAGIIHRDLKAQNVMVIARDGKLSAKLVDFGVAKLLTPEMLGVSQVITASTILGTPYYMAPEQILGQPVDARTDIYALGLLFYELVTAELPFRGETRVEVEEKHLRAPPPRVSDVAAVPEALDAVVARCLAKDPADRYPNVSAFLEDLRARIASIGDKGDLRPAPRQGVAVLVEARLDPSIDEVPDEAFADSERLLELARVRLVEARMVIEVETPVSVLGVAPLPREESAHQAERRRILAVAEALDAELAARPGASPILTISLTVHVGEDLLCLGEWAPPEPKPGLSITPATLHGL